MSAPLPSALAALITPFERSGEVDLEAHRHNVKHLAALGLNGVLIGGSTGEGPYLEAGERQRLVATARESEPDGYVMVGIAAETVRTAVAQLSEGVSAGAQSALVLTPTTMSRGDLPAVLRFYLALAAESPISLLLYSVPKWTAYELPESAIHQLAGVRGITGMKDSGGDIRRIARIAADAPPGFRLFNGASAVLGQAMWSGAYGGITASGNYAPLLLRKVVSGRELDDQRALARLAAAVERGGIAAVKAAAEATGMRAGYPRAPLARLSDEESGRIAGLLQA